MSPSEDVISITESSLYKLPPLFPAIYGSVKIRLKLAILMSSLVPPGPSILYLD
jgi:hypothetical protein